MVLIKVITSLLSTVALLGCIQDAKISLKSNTDDSSSSSGGSSSPVTPPPFRLALGANHSCILTPDGRVKCWGGNGTGQLGYENSLTKGDNPGEMGTNLPFVDFGSGRTAIAISAGANFTCALLDNNKVKCWGDNSSGQLGQGDIINRGDNAGEMGDNLPYINFGDDGTNAYTVKAISAGQSHACAILNNDKVKCWGINNFGGLGYEDSVIRGDNPGEMGNALPFVNLGTGRTVYSISSGSNHNCVILDNGQTKCWGDNINGQVGVGDTNYRGDALGEMGDNLPYVSLNSPAGSVYSMRHYSACAISVDNSLRCWGKNINGELGIGNTSDVYAPQSLAIDLGSGVSAWKTATGYQSSCVLLGNNTVKCFGNNLYGQLGVGHTSHIGDNGLEMGNNLVTVDFGVGRSVKSVAAGNYHYCAILDNNRVKCWGLNSSGQLGLSDIANRGDNVAEMGDNLPLLELGL